jgi:hypothetical protein
MLKKYGAARIAIIAFVLLGFRFGLSQISDNSALTHFRTGLEMSPGFHFPHHDPYSFTAAGLVWRTQSWLPEYIYGSLLHLNHSGYLLLIFNALIGAFFIFLLIRMCASDSVSNTVANGFIAVGLGSIVLSPRTVVFALVCCALLLTLLKSKSSPWWAIPIGAVWQWSHGSWIIGAGILGLIAIGSFLDRDIDRRCLRLLGYFLIGVVASSLFPYGPVSLFFFLTPLHRPEVFKGVIEWRSPDFQMGFTFVILFALVAYIARLARIRPTWRFLLPSIVLITASLWSVRNFGFLSIFAAFTLGAHTLFSEEEQPVSKSLNMILYALILVVALSVTLSAFEKPAFDFSTYPVKAIRYLQATGYVNSNLRMAHRESVGNYLICRYGKKYKVFDDDRFDLYPLQHERDTDSLIQGSHSYADVLNRNKISLVLWTKKTGLTQWLRGSSDWKEIYGDKKWIVFARKGTRPSKSITPDLPTPCA